MVLAFVPQHKVVSHARTETAFPMCFSYIVGHTDHKTTTHRDGDRFYGTGIVAGWDARCQRWKVSSVDGTETLELADDLESRSRISGLECRRRPQWKMSVILFAILHKFGNCEEHFCSMLRITGHLAWELLMMDMESMSQYPICQL